MLPQPCKSLFQSLEPRVLMAAGDTVWDVPVHATNTVAVVNGTVYVQGGKVGDPNENNGFSKFDTTGKQLTPSDSMFPVAMTGGIAVASGGAVYGHYSQSIYLPGTTTVTGYSPRIVKFTPSNKVAWQVPFYDPPYSSGRRPESSPPRYRRPPAR